MLVTSWYELRVPNELLKSIVSPVEIRAPLSYSVAVMVEDSPTLIVVGLAPRVNKYLVKLTVAVAVAPLDVAVTVAVPDSEQVRLTSAVPDVPVITDD